MGFKLYDRIARVTIGFVSGEIKPIVGLRVQFKIEKNVKKNKLSITIYNLTKETRNRIRSTGNKISLEVGYAGLLGEPGFLEILAIGDINFVNSVKQGVDWLTTITSGDGDKARRLAEINESFPPETQVKEMFEKGLEKVKEFLSGIESESIVFTILESIRTATSESEVEGTSITEAITQFGTTASGNAAKFLDDLADTHGLEWSVQNDVVTVNEVAADNGKPPILISPTTGLVDSPTRGENGLVKMRTLILPGIDPGRRLRLQSSIEGDYKTIKADFDGDTHGQPWYADIEATPL